MSGWLIAILATLGTLLLGVVKADLEDAKVCRWLARHLIYRAAERLPRAERARWREEAISDTLALPPGRLPPLLWALDVYRRSGSWAQTRGAPSRWELLVERVRAAWEWVRSLPQARTRSREESKQHHPSRNEETAQEIMATAGIDAAPAVGMAAVGTTRSSGTATLGRPQQPWATPAGWRDGMRHLSDHDFIRWLDQQRQAFDDHIDRQIEEYRLTRDRVLAGG